MTGKKMSSYTYKKTVEKQTTSVPVHGEQNVQEISQTLPDGTKVVKKVLNTENGDKVLEDPEVKLQQEKQKRGYEKM